MYIALIILATFLIGSPIAMACIAIHYMNESDKCGAKAMIDLLKLQELNEEANDRKERYRNE